MQHWLLSVLALPAMHVGHAESGLRCNLALSNTILMYLLTAMYLHHAWYDMLYTSTAVS